MKTNYNKTFDIINFLRFPLIVGVVFIHSLVLENENYTVYSFLLKFISNTICSISVPLFFFFSGYLFFYSSNNYNLNFFVGKLKRRIKSLVFPYLFWNLFCVIVIFVCQLLFPQLFSGNFVHIRDFTLTDWVSCFWCALGTDKPIAFQLWFLRDLIIISFFLSFIIFYLNKYFKIYWLCILFVLYIIDINIFVGVGFNPTISIFYFSLGAYLSQNSFPLTTNNNLTLIILFISYVIGIILEFVLPEDFQLFIHRINVLIGCSLVIFISNYLSFSKTINKKISNSSFFIYCYHGIFSLFIIKIISMMHLVQNDFTAVFYYLLIPIVIILIGVLAFNLLNYALPSFTRFIVGGRN